MTRCTLLVIVCLLMAACTGPACLQDQPYQKAQPFPGLQAPPGLTVPEPDPNFDVPEVASGPVGALDKDEVSGEEQMRCLAMPPRFESRDG